MRAIMFRGEGIIDVVDAPKPEPGEGELLIRVAANGLCGSDRKILQSGFDRIPGHEVAGTVVEAGPGCRTAIGARIGAYIPMHCGECVFCQQGKGNLCREKKGLLGWSTDGGYAEYMIVPDRNALLLENDISFAEGVVLLDTLGTSGHAIRLAHCQEVETALVIGAGPIGMGAVVGLKAFGVPQVYVSEISAWRRDMAARFGGIPIDPTAVDLEERLRDDHPYGAEIVVEAVGQLPTIWKSLDLVQPGGTVCLVGEYWGKVELDRPKGAWMINDITAIRSFYFTIPEFYENQRMIRQGKLNAAALATHRFPLEGTRAAYDLFASGESCKIVVEP